MGKFEIKINQVEDALKVKMEGVIDEDIDFNKFNIGTASVVDFDLSGIKSINSCGIREWIKWMATNKSGAIQFHQCPKVIVDQINMVDGFLPSNGKVLSFYVPYYNDDSGAEKNILFRLGSEFTENSVTPPSDIKDDAGNEMEIDVIESKYFKFIKK